MSYDEPLSDGFPPADDMPDVWDGDEGALPDALRPAGGEEDWQTSPRKVDPARGAGPAVLFESGTRRNSGANDDEGREQSFGSRVLSSLVGHVAVPGTIIAMVASLLFFLYDVRSVFLPGALQLKWLGFWFVWATVLIARYGRFAQGGVIPPAGYSGILGIVTFFAMAASPWEAPEAGLIGPLSNGVILVVVWRFATALTVALSSDLDPPSTDTGTKLYGLERLEMERMAAQRDGRGPVSVYELGRRHERRRRARSVADPAMASRSVTRLALVGLLIFALGEPALVAGHPAAAGRALVAMMVFLMSTALLMSAAGCWTFLQRVRSQGGDVEPSMVARRLGASFGLMSLLLAVALATPGLLLEGRGEIQAPEAVGPSRPGPGGETSRDRQPTADEPGSQGGEEAVSGEAADGAGRERSGGESTGDPGRQDSGGDRFGLGVLAALAGMLRGPLRVLAVLILLFVLWRAARGRFKGFRRGELLRRLGELWRRFLAAFGPRSRPSSAQNSRQNFGDPFADLDALGTAEPRQGILEAFARLRIAWHIHGHVPDPHLTPTEMVASLPRSLSRLKPASRRLAELYGHAAYGDGAVGSQDLRDGLAALGEVAAEHRALTAGPRHEDGFDKVST